MGFPDLLRTIRNTIETAGYVCGIIGAVSFILAFAEYSHWPIANALSIPIDGITKPIVFLNTATFGLPTTTDVVMHSVQSHSASGAWLLALLLLSGRIAQYIRGIEIRITHRLRKIKNSKLGQKSQRALTEMSSPAATTNKAKLPIDHGIVSLFRFTPMSVTQEHHEEIKELIEDTLLSFNCIIISFIEEDCLYMFRHQNLASTLALMLQLVEKIKTYNAALKHPSEGYQFQGAVHSIETTDELFESDSYLKAVIDCAANNQILATPEAYQQFSTVSGALECQKDLDIVFHGVYVNMGPRQKPCDIYRLIKQL